MSDYFAPEFTDEDDYQEHIKPSKIVPWYDDPDRDYDQDDVDQRRID